MEAHKCPDCGGSGAIILATFSGLEYEDIAERCSTCEGFGSVKPTCERCDGAGWIEGRDHADGSSSTSRPCPKCSGTIVTD